MTRLFKESENQQDQMNSSTLAHLFAPLFNDFRETFHDFWEQTIYPVLHMISQTFSILWHQALLPAVHRWMTDLRERWLYGGFFGKKKANENVETVVALDSMPLRKIYGALGERWPEGSRSDRPIRVSVGKKNPWVAAEKRSMAVISGKQKASMASHVLKDDIRGLDDIFISPVQGSFLDVISKKGRGGKAKPVSREARIPSKPAAVVTQEVVSPSKGSLNRMAELAKTHDALRQETLRLGHRVKNIAEATDNWFNREMPDLGILSMELDEKVPVPYHFYSLDVTPAFAPAASAASTDLPVQVPVPEVTKSLRVLQNPVKAPQPVSKFEILPRRTPLRPEPTEFKDEVSDELNGLGYIAQSNRILSKSISNLVDRYFQQASLEKESHYY
jgi:hypothetical protein